MSSIVDLSAFCKITLSKCLRTPLTLISRYSAICLYVFPRMKNSITYLSRGVILIELFSDL